MIIKFKFYIINKIDIKKYYFFKLIKKLIKFLI